MTMKKKEKTQIKLETLPNGYSLEVGNKKYMYFTLAELVSGFIVHVGMGIDDYMDKEELNDIVTVLLKLKPSKADIKKLARQEMLTRKSEETAAKRKKSRVRDSLSTAESSPATEPYSHPDIIPPASDIVIRQRLMVPLKNATDLKNVVNVARRMLQEKFGKPFDAATITLGDVARLTDDDILKADFKPKAVIELRKLMSMYHLTFGMDVDKYIKQ